MEVNGIKQLDCLEVQNISRTIVPSDWQRLICKFDYFPRFDQRTKLVED